MANIAQFTSNPVISIIAHHHRSASDDLKSCASISVVGKPSSFRIEYQLCSTINHIVESLKSSDSQPSISPPTSILKTTFGKPTLPKSIPQPNHKQHIARIIAAVPQPYGVIPPRKSKKRSSSPNPHKTYSNLCFNKNNEISLKKDVFWDDQEDLPQERRFRGEKYDEALQVLLSNSPLDDPIPELTSTSEDSIASSSLHTRKLSVTLRTPVDCEPLTSLDGDEDDYWTIDDFRERRRTRSLSSSSLPLSSSSPSPSSSIMSSSPPPSPPPSTTSTKIVDLFVEKLPALIKTSTAALFKTPPNVALISPSDSPLEREEKFYQNHILSSENHISYLPSRSSFLFEPDDDFTGLAEEVDIFPKPRIFPPGGSVHLQTFKLCRMPVQDSNIPTTIASTNINSSTPRSGRANIVGWGSDLRSNSSHLRMLVCEMQMIKNGKLIAPLKPRVFLPPRKRSNIFTSSSLIHELHLQ